ncbi:glycosyltransferase [Actinosynnema sp. NPDC047251]|uniref:Glycosyltransferase, family 2 n=1 Tax=Saccharothrix espanaensis (strain ATCC 51144 / DSM 44229 / JCM 9112 / NBRC 15066 / NRRL 15764) TaxID=1179773 RepID=K0JTI7_SACES|nr:glycosyltransferase [Saccharothrix espanaensis]CCH28862.1 Glycosyltransferase, family 2 [Saccharothrix espanaensis DSM 44229]
MRAHWVSLLVGLALLLGALAFHAYATAIPPKSARPAAVAEPVPAGVAALVFHGGPDARYTPRLLDRLAQRRVRATFFVVGAAVNAHPELVRRMVDEGHEVGVGTFRAGPDGALDPAFARAALAAATGVHTGLSEPDPDTLDLTVRDPPAIVAGTDVRQVVRLHVNSSAPDVVDLLLHRLPGHRFVSLSEARAGSGERAVAGERSVAGVGGEGAGAEGAGAEGGGGGSAGIGVRMTGHALAFAQWHGGAIVVVLGVVSGIVAVLALLRTVMQLGLAHTSRRLRRVDAVLGQDVGPDYAPDVSVVVPAYNESANIVAAVRSIVSSSHSGDVEVVVVDDGSDDGTGDLVEALGLPAVRVHRQENAGKPAALNAGIALARHEVLVLVDGDTVFDADTVTKVVRPLGADRVGAVSGNVKVANRRGVFGRWQHLEYCAGSNLDRQILNALGCLPTIPGAIGAFRREALDEVGGISADTLAEDTDVTMAITRAGWKVVYEPGARAWTEVPTGVRGLYKQRYRWSYGTFQSMWKHRAARGRMGRLGLAYLLVFHVVLPLLAPALDVFVLYGAFIADAPWALVVWAVFLAMQTLSAGYALRLDGESLKPLWTFPLQQLAYRQLTYLVVVKSLVAALHGTPVRWQSSGRAGLAVEPVG